MLACHIFRDILTFIKGNSFTENQIVDLSKLTLQKYKNERIKNLCNHLLKENNYNEYYKGLKPNEITPHQEKVLHLMRVEQFMNPLKTLSITDDF